MNNQEQSGKLKIKPKDDINKNEIDEKRREMLSRLKKLSFVAPVTLATMSMKANACSVSC